MKHYKTTEQVPVKAVIYSHSHIDHFGGVEGVVSKEDVENGKVKVIAPQDFLNEAVSENVYAGTAMGRRADYMYGTPLLKPSVPGGKSGGGLRGQVDAGLGKAVSSGTPGIVAPTHTIVPGGDTEMIVDGVHMIFQLTPHTEAPAEMTTCFPEFKALNIAEIACPLMHNLLTMRGAQVRDALQWSHYLTQTLERFGGVGCKDSTGPSCEHRTEIMIGQHNWPRWGAEAIQAVLASQRDSCKHIHDQSLRLTNLGYTMNELAEMVTLPDSLKKRWFNQGYYGSLKHNAKAIYQKYIGWYDANPAHLDPLPDSAASKKYIEYMGGSLQGEEGLKAGLKLAHEDYKNGNYRWVVQVMNHAVFACPAPDSSPAKSLLSECAEAANLQADALEQLAVIRLRLQLGAIPTSWLLMSCATASLSRKKAAAQVHPFWPP